MSVSRTLTQRRRRHSARPSAQIQASLTSSLRHRRRSLLSEKVCARTVASGVAAARARLEADRRLEAVYFRIAQPLVRHLFQEEIVDISAGAMWATRERVDGYLRANCAGEFERYVGMLKRLSAIRRGWMGVMVEGAKDDEGVLLDEMEAEMNEEVCHFFSDLGISSPLVDAYDSP